MERNGAISAITGRRNGICEGRNFAIVVTDQIEIDGFGMLRGSDDAKSVTCECLGVELQADIHILTSGGTEALTCRLGGINIQH